MGSHKKRTPGKTGYYGVQPKLWGRRHHRVVCKNIYIGSFFCPIDGAKAYDKAAKEMYGKAAILNFPAGEPTDAEVAEKYRKELEALKLELELLRSKK